MHTCIWASDSKDKKVKLIDAQESWYLMGAARVWLISSGVSNTHLNFPIVAVIAGCGS